MFNGTFYMHNENLRSCCKRLPLFFAIVGAVTCSLVFLSKKNDLTVESKIALVTVGIACSLFIIYRAIKSIVANSHKIHLHRKEHEVTNKISNNNDNKSVSADEKKEDADVDVQQHVSTKISSSNNDEQKYYIDSQQDLNEAKQILIS